MGEIKLKARRDPEFPSHNTFGKFGGKRALAAQLEKFCRDRDENELAELCAVAAKTDDAEDAEGVPEETATGELGYVYLMKAGRFYKIGRTNALGRRERELAIQLPEAAKVIHSIKTDDPGGIEEYWHRRFQDRRKNGEWFELTSQDLAAFRRRKLM
jgi:Meiotically up-regulated gene 113